jgi:hypothetical protein
MGLARKKSLAKPYINNHSLDKGKYLLSKDNAFTTMDIRIIHLM